MDPSVPAIEGYRVLRRLAVGGMAEVFLAESEELSGGTELVVIKRLLPGAADEVRRLLERERVVLGHVDSPHVVKLLGGSGDAVVLEHVDGTDLAGVLDHFGRRGRCLPLPAAMAVIEGVLSGLADLHEARRPDGRPLQAVHRDLSPSNVLLGRDGRVKLADLGVVHADLSQHPTVGGLKGTLTYMAPEQLLGQPVDARTDVYAAGLLVYEVLCGVPARPAGMVGLAELIDARRRLPAPPTHVRSTVPGPLGDAVLHALEPDPEERPVGARAWLEEIRAACPESADRDALAAEVLAVCGPAGPAGAVGSARRDTAPGMTVAAATGDLPRPRKRSLSRRVILSALALLALGVLIGAFSLSRPPGPEPGAAGSTAAPPPPSVAQGRVEDAGAREEPAPDAAKPPALPSAPERPLPPPASDVQEPPTDTPSSAPPAPDAGKPAAARAPAAASAKPQPAASRTDRRAPREPRKPATAIPRLRVRALGGAPVHVTGPGMQGFAPRSSSPLQGEAHLLTLRGPGGAVARVRVSRKEGRWRATIGTPAGAPYLKVSCGGRERGHTPVRGLSLDGALRCTLSTEAGTSFGFDLSVTGK